MKKNIIKEICDACWMDQQELALYSGIKLQRIKNISSGRVDGFKSDDIAMLVHKLHLNPEWLTTGIGDIFKQGYSRDFPSKGEFVADILNRMVKLVDPIQYQPVIDEVLEIEAGTAKAWIKQGKIPYWFLLNFASKNSMPVDALIYGRSQAARDLYSKDEKSPDLALRQGSISQFNIKDYTKYAEKFQEGLLERFLSHLVVLAPRHQKMVMDLAEEFYESDTKLKEITRLRAKPESILSEASNGRNKISATKLPKPKSG